MLRDLRGYLTDPPEENTITKTFESYRDANAWHKRYDPLAPKKGDMAPDFQLRDINGENLVRLSEFQDQKPVALVFGSFT